jgi:photosystem II stability/assembly factor-like uncharacterized protein
LITTKTDAVKTRSTLLLLAAFFGALTFRAQTGLHVQQYYGGYSVVHSPDSIFMGLNVPSGSFRRMALYNPSTKDWKYVNSTDYTPYAGPFVMRNNMEGVMFGPSVADIYKTTDGWQTLTTVPNVANGWGLDQVVSTPAGYAGYEPALRDLYFSPDGITWTMAQGTGSGGTPMLKNYGNKVVLFKGASGNYVSTDGGQNFSSVTFSTTFSGNLVDFVMLSADTFIVATQFNVHKSFDGGTTWTSNATPASISEIAVKNSNEYFAFVSGQPYTSADGGVTWQQKTPLPFISYINTFYINNDFYAWPDYRSSDNGVTWQEVFPNAGTMAGVYDLHFNGSNGIIGRTNGKVHYSNDKGRSYSLADTIPTGEDIMAVRLLNSGYYLAGDRDGQVFVSTDNGLTWSQKNTNNIPINPRKFSVSADEKVIVMSRAGMPMVSTDSANTFTMFNVGGGDHSQTVKPSGEIIDVGGWFDYVTFQYKGWEISRYSPAGVKTVIDTFLAVGEALVDIHMASNTVGYLVTFDNTTKVTKVYKTTNGWAGGTTLVSSINPVMANVTNYPLGLTRIRDFGTDTLILFADGKTFWHYSYDGGATWTQDGGLTIHATYPSLYPTLKKSHFFTPTEYMFALNSSGLYLNTSSSSVPNGLGEEETPEKDDQLLFPNPASNAISILGATGTLQEVRIYDCTGKLFFVRQNHPAAEAIDVSFLPAGIYFLHATGEDGNVSAGRFIKTE